MSNTRVVQESHLGPDQYRSFAASMAGLEKVSPEVMDWHRFRHTLFCAEYAVCGKDVVYHFFPPEEHQHFQHAKGFADSVERAFQRVYPKGADVRADLVQGRVVEQIRKADGDTQSVPIEIAPLGENRPPQDSWHITAVGWGTRQDVMHYAGDQLMRRVVEELMLVGS